MNSLPQPQLAIKAEPGEVRRASDWLDTLLNERAVAQSARERLSICLNEVLANIIAHGGSQARLLPVWISLDENSIDSCRQVGVTVTDAGLPFDPTQATPKPLATSLELVEPGGLGIVMLRNNADRLDYLYEHGRNCLRFSVTANSA